MTELINISGDETADRARVLASQYPRLIGHLPAGEMPPDEDVQDEFAIDDATNRIVIRTASGAMYFLLPDDLGGAVRLTVVDGYERYEHFRDGEFVGAYTGPTPPQIAALN